jgi:Ca2+-binding RTX toxin-like protein
LKNVNIFNNGGTITIEGTAGNDSLDFSSVSVNLAIFGIIGGDTITGGSGTNSLNGGVGNDQFVFSKGVGINSINDFTAGDLIDLKNSSFNIGYSGQLLSSSDFNSSATHSASGGDGAKIHYDTSNHTVYYENGSTTTAIVTLTNAYNLTASDFKVI